MLQDIGQLATAVGVFLAWLTLRAARRQRLRQFETIYVQRYWTLMDGLSTDAAAGRRSGGLAESDEKIARAYIRLCEDELELRREGWISAVTWRIWRDGIAAQMGRWPFCEAWNRIEHANKHVPEKHREFELLRKFLAGQTNPRTTLTWTRRIARALRPAP